MSTTVQLNNPAGPVLNQELTMTGRSALPENAHIDFTDPAGRETNVANRVPVLDAAGRPTIGPDGKPVLRFQLNTATSGAQSMPPPQLAYWRTQLQTRHAQIAAALPTINAARAAKGLPPMNLPPLPREATPARTSSTP